MKVEHPNALRFILQDEIYLLDEDKRYYQSNPSNFPGEEFKPEPAIETIQENFNYLGSNKKNFLILVSYAAHEFMPDEHLLALESVLTRKGYSRDDVVILNLDKHETVDHGQLLSHFKPETMVLLGKGSIPPGMEHPQFNLQVSLNGLKLLYTFGFDEMMANNDHKKAFWEQMKAL